MSQESSSGLRPSPSKYLQLPSNQGKVIPYPYGPLTTGCCDLLFGKDIEGSFIRLYYPTDEGPIKDRPRKLWTKWSIGEKYYAGTAVGLFQLSFFVFGLLTLFRYIYVKVAHFMLKNVLIPAIWEAPVMKSENDRKIPVVVFSHGLIANRTFYSSICNDIASYGFVVAAVEHRDESSSATFTIDSEGKRHWLDYKEVVKGDKAEVILRTKQVQIRSQECSRALDILNQLNEGIPLKNLLPSSFDLESLVGRLDLSKPSIVGQSFGGATAIKALSDDKRFHSGISLDPWMLPLGLQAEPIGRAIKQPILFILTEKFQDQKNMDYLKLFQNERNTFYTIKGAVHLHQVDIGILLDKEPVLIRKIVDAYSPTFSAIVPLTINNAMVAKFLFQCLDQEIVMKNEIEQLLKNEDKYIFNGIQGSAKSMLGWASYDKPLSAYIN